MVGRRVTGPRAGPGRRHGVLTAPHRPSNIAPPDGLEGAEGRASDPLLMPFGTGGDGRTGHRPHNNPWCRDRRSWVRDAVEICTVTESMGRTSQVAAVGQHVSRRVPRLATDADEARLPITDRVLAALPGSRLAWTILWGVIVLVRPLAASAFLLASGRPSEARSVLEVHLTHNLVLALVVLLALQGIHLLARDGTRALRAVGGLDSASPEPPDRPIRGIDNVVGPLVIAAAAVLAESASPMVPSSPVANLVDGVLVAAFAVPVATWIWTYGAVLVAIDRLGRRSLPHEAFPADRGLGLLPIGSVPFKGFWLFAVAALANFVLVANSLIGYAIGLGLFLGVLAALVVSFWRLHRQMVSAKSRYLAEARRLLSEASEPFDRDPSLDTLEAQSRRVAAAEAFEKRAEGILEWPIDERIVTRTVLIATGAVAGLIARVVATQFGA
jgi:hypothetical protein